MVITQGWIAQHATGQAGWTRAQLECLGVDWPPTKGWRSRLINTSISDAKAREFERLGAVRRQRLAKLVIERDGELFA